MKNFAKRSSHDYRVDFLRITGFSVSVLKSETILAFENKSFTYKSLKMFLSSISYLNRGNSACNYTANYVAKDRLKVVCAQPKCTITDAIDTKESSPFADEEKDIIELVDWTQ